MTVQVIFWMLGGVFRRAWPRLNGICLWLCCLLLLEGMWMLINAKACLDFGGSRLVVIKTAWEGLPGSIERNLSLAAVRRFHGLLGIVLFVSDLSCRPIWRRRLWVGMGFAGLSIIGFGLIERFLKAPMIFWEADRASNTFFATYFYHANAGAFINLVLPLIAGLAVVGSLGRSPLRQAFWVAALMLTVAGAFVNFSRGAQVTTGLIGIALGVWQWRWRFRGRADVMRWAAAASLTVIVIMPIALLGWNSTGKRWIELYQRPSTAGRSFAARVTWRMDLDAGPFGFGPGTFRVAFPYYLTTEEKARSGTWRYAHEDYLQTVAEWGWLGAGLWAGLFGGGIAACLHTYFIESRLAVSDRILVFCSSVALAGVAFHALFDFPLQIASLQLYTAVYVGIGWGSLQWVDFTHGTQFVALDEPGRGA
jgi:hypothetical protein